MSPKYTTVRLRIGGQQFEILVKPDLALTHKTGKKQDVSQVIAMEEIYSEATKGTRHSEEKLNKSFGTSNTMEIIETILNKGELQLTTEQRRQLIGDKKKQIISLISRNYVDPRTGTPHPPMRIEQAFVEARVSVDPFKSSDEQAKLMADQIRAILPLKADKVKLQIKVPAAFTSQSLSILKNYGDIMKEDWGSQGVLTALVEIPAGVQSGLLDKLGSLTKGGAEITLIK
ncbi:MAG: ribosome assembly factor SBDS [Thaumarchaeota archaeon]|nr:ribosome assembly factor SBDS [Nitrososphaerota archaeon]